jgi:hypothetical protein
MQVCEWNWQWSYSGLLDGYHGAPLHWHRTFLDLVRRHSKCIVVALVIDHMRAANHVLLLFVGPGCHLLVHVLGRILLDAARHDSEWRRFAVLIKHRGTYNVMMIVDLLFVFDFRLVVLVFLMVYFCEPVRR